MENEKGFDKQGFKEFLSSLSFSDAKGFEGIQRLLQFYCLYGVKENEFAAILSFFLQKHSQDHKLNFTTVLNSSLPKTYELLDSLPLGKGHVSHLRTIDNSNKSIIEKILCINKKGELRGKPIVIDIKIFDREENLHHVIELKSDRRQAYLAELDGFGSTGKIAKESLLQALVTDLKVLASLQAFALYKGTTFWQGILTYSFQETGKPYPEGFPKYIKYESGTDGSKRRIANIRNEEDEQRWFEICAIEMKKLKEQLENFLSKQNYLKSHGEIFEIPVAQGVVDLHTDTKNSSARVLVKSELFVFEVTANKDYLKSIAPQIRSAHHKALQKTNGNKKKGMKKPRVSRV